MSRLKITINLDNAAFEDDLINEVHDILGRVDCLVERFGREGHGIGPYPLRDSNGNTVGRAVIVEDES